MPELYALNKFDDATPAEIEAALEEAAGDDSLSDFSTLVVPTNT